MPLIPGAEPYSADGGSTGILLLHGFTGSPKSMKPWGERMAAAGHTVRVPRLPGHGTRCQDMNLTRWEDWYAEADRSFLELQRAIAGEGLDAVVGRVLAHRRTPSGGVDRVHASTSFSAETSAAMSSSVVRSVAATTMPFASAASCG